jgi:hypothetical protein
MRLLTITTAMLLLVSLGSCAGTDQPREAELAAALPALDALAQVTRTASAAQFKAGDDVFSFGGNVNFSTPGSAIFLTGAGQLSWAIYGGFAANQIWQSVTVDARDYTTDGAMWVGVSDFAAGSWRFFELNDLGNTLDFADPAGTFANDSSIGFVAVLAVDGDGFTADSVTIGTQAVLPPNPVQAVTFGVDEVYEYFEACDIDSAGNLNVAGSTGSLSTGDLVISQYAPAGNRTFAQLFDGASPTYAWDIATDNLDNSIVVGSAYPLPTTPRGAAWKFDQAGALDWAVLLDAANNLSLQAIATDDDGNSYLAGYNYTGTSHGLVVGLSPTGTLLWSKQVSNAISADMQYNDIATAGEFVFLSGIIKISSSVSFGQLLVMDAATGEMVSAIAWPHAGSSGYFVTQIELEPAGTILWAGSYIRNGVGHYDLLRLSFDGTMAPEVVQQFGYQESLGGLVGLKTDSTGVANMLIIGEGGDSRLIRLNSSGVLLDALGIVNGDDPPSIAPYNMLDLALTTGDDVYMVGYGPGSVAGTQWTDAGGLAFTPAVNPIEGEAGEFISDDYAITVLPLGGTLTAAPGEENSPGTDFDGVLLRADF